MKGLNRPYYTRHRDDEIIDEVSFRVVPRYKTSGLSGDEWRVSTVVDLKRKGEILYSRSYHSMSDAAAHLPWLLRTWIEILDKEGNDRWGERIRKDDRTCHQPGCPESSTITYRLKKEFSREGFEKDLTDNYCEIRRSFCEKHKVRGDCGLEDSDKNYEVVCEEKDV